MEIGPNNLPVNPNQNVQRPGDTAAAAQPEEAERDENSVTPEIPQSAAPPPEETEAAQRPEPAQAADENQPPEPDRGTNEGQGRFIDTFV